MCSRAVCVDRDSHRLVMLSPLLQVQLLLQLLLLRLQALHLHLLVHCTQLQFRDTPLQRINCLEVEKTGCSLGSCLHASTHRGQGERKHMASPTCCPAEQSHSPVSKWRVGQHTLSEHPGSRSALCSSPLTQMWVTASREAAPSHI